MTEITELIKKVDDRKKKEREKRKKRQLEHDASIRSQVLDEAKEEIGKLPDLIYLGEDNKTEITLADGIWKDDVINTLERMKK